MLFKCKCQILNKQHLSSFKLVMGYFSYQKMKWVVYILHLLLWRSEYALTNEKFKSSKLTLLISSFLFRCQCCVDCSVSFKNKLHFIFIYENSNKQKKDNKNTKLNLNSLSSNTGPEFYGKSQTPISIPTGLHPVKPLTILSSSHTDHQRPGDGLAPSLSCWNL